MSMHHQEEWEDLLIYLSDRQCRGLACMRLERLAGPWPGDAGQLQKAMTLASQQSLHEFFLLYLVSRVLLAGGDSPAWLRAWLKRHRVMDGIMPGLSLGQALSLRWQAVPVPIVGFDGQGGVLRMMLAQNASSSQVIMPQWARESLDDVCLEALANAVRSCQNLGTLPGPEGFYCWPVLDPKGPLIRGGSLGLPLSLAMCLLSQGLAFPAALMATGGISAEGLVLPVGGLVAKVQAAAAEGVGLFLYPDDEKVDFAEWPIPALPVKDLSQALLFAQLVTLDLGASANLRLYQACLQDPVLMLDNFHQMPPSLLRWASDRGLLRPVAALSQDTEGFARLVDRLADANQSEQHKEVLAGLLSDEDLTALAARSSQDALMASNWYRCLLELATEKNQPEQAKVWKRQASRILREFGNKIYVFYRTDDRNHCYRRFDMDFASCLEVMDRQPLKRLVGRAWEHKLVFIHLPIRRSDEVSARVFFAPDNKVMALSLNALNLNIDPETGCAVDMEECLYAVYLGLIRAAFVINREAIMADGRIHALLAGHLRGLVRQLMRNEGEEGLAGHELLGLCCDYYYARRFLGLAAQAVLGRLQDPGFLRGQQGGGDKRGAILERLETCAGESELSQILAKAGLTAHPTWLQHRLAGNLGGEALYSLRGVLDNYMGLCVLSSYASEMSFGRLSLSPQPGQEVETLLLPYLEGISLAGAAEESRPGV